jgi:hypothetical protein
MALNFITNKHSFQCIFFSLAKRRPLVKPFSELLFALCIQTDDAQARPNGLAI